MVGLAVYRPTCHSYIVSAPHYHLWSLQRKCPFELVLCRESLLLLGARVGTGRWLAMFNKLGTRPLFSDSKGIIAQETTISLRSTSEAKVSPQKAATDLCIS